MIHVQRSRVFEFMWWDLGSQKNEKRQFVSLKNENS